MLQWLHGEQLQQAKIKQCPCVYLVKGYACLFIYNSRPPAASAVHLTAEHCILGSLGEQMERNNFQLLALFLLLYKRKIMHLRRTCLPTYNY